MILSVDLCTPSSRSRPNTRPSFFSRLPSRCLVVPLRRLAARRPRAPLGVLAHAALEDLDVAAVLEGERVRAHAVEEEAVVAHDDHAARELEERLARSIAGQGSWLDGPAQALGWGQGGVRASGQGQR